MNELSFLRLASFCNKFSLRHVVFNWQSVRPQVEATSQRLLFFAGCKSGFLIIISSFFRSRAKLNFLIFFCFRLMNYLHCKLHSSGHRCLLSERCNAVKMQFESRHFSRDQTVAYGYTDKFLEFSFDLQIPRDGIRYMRAIKTRRARLFVDK